MNINIESLTDEQIRREFLNQHQEIAREASLIYMATPKKINLYDVLSYASTVLFSNRSAKLDQKSKTRTVVIAPERMKEILTKEIVLSEQERKELETLLVLFGTGFQEAEVSRPRRDESFYAKFKPVPKPVNLAAPHDIKQAPVDISHDVYAAERGIIIKQDIAQYRSIKLDVAIKLISEIDDIYPSFIDYYFLDFVLQSALTVAVTGEDYKKSNRELTHTVYSRENEVISHGILEKVNDEDQLNVVYYTGRYFLSDKVISLLSSVSTKVQTIVLKRLIALLNSNINQGPFNLVFVIGDFIKLLKENVTIANDLVKQIDGLASRPRYDSKLNDFLSYFNASLPFKPESAVLYRHLNQIYYDVLKGELLTDIHKEVEQFLQLDVSNERFATLYVMYLNSDVLEEMLMALARGQTGQINKKAKTHSESVVTMIEDELIKLGKSLFAEVTLFYHMFSVDHANKKISTLAVKAKKLLADIEKYKEGQNDGLFVDQVVRYFKLITMALILLQEKKILVNERQHALDFLNSFAANNRITISELRPFKAQYVVFTELVYALYERSLLNSDEVIAITYLPSPLFIVFRSLLLEVVLNPKMVSLLEGDIFVDRAENTVKSHVYGLLHGETPPQIRQIDEFIEEVQASVFELKPSEIAIDFTGLTESEAIEKIANLSLFQKTNKNTRKTLITGIRLLIMLQETLDADFSGVVMYGARALEEELFHQLYLPYRHYLEEKYPNPLDDDDHYNEWPQSFFHSNDKEFWIMSDDKVTLGTYIAMACRQTYDGRPLFGGWTRKSSFVLFLRDHLWHSLELEFKQIERMLDNEKSGLQLYLNRVIEVRNQNAHRYQGSVVLDFGGAQSFINDVLRIISMVHNKNEGKPI